MSKEPDTSYGVGARSSREETRCRAWAWLGVGLGSGLGLGLGLGLRLRSGLGLEVPRVGLELRRERRWQDALVS